jgi:NitT/TauT family transport system permease protein
MLEKWLTKGAKSKAHAEYLRKQRLEKMRVTVCQWGLLFFLIALWEYASYARWIDPLLFSSPSKIWHEFASMLFAGTLHAHILATITETVAGFLLGTLFGPLAAAVIWSSPFLSKVLDPYLVVLNGMPKVALGPIFIVAFGGGFTAIISMSVAVSVIITTIVVYTSFKEVDANLIKLARTFGANRWQLFFKIIVPASFPTIVSTLKVNVGLSWIGVIVGEFLVSKLGLGYLIIYGFQVFNLTLVFVSLFVIAICATVMYHLVSMLERALLKNRE